VLAILSVGYFISVTGSPAMTIALAAGQAGIVAAYSVLAAGLNIAITLALAPLFGQWGVVAGTAAAISIAEVIWIFAYHRRERISLRAYLDAVRPAAVVSLFLGLPLMLVYALGVSPATTRLGALVATGAIMLTYACAYWLVAGRLGLLPEKLTPPQFRPRDAAVTTR
jgi:O-antigen/teichoic acid export membrane protein